MRVIKFATGLAVGYVLGSRAGREKYEQIVAGFRQLGSHTGAVPAERKTEEKTVDLHVAAVESTADKVTSRARTSDATEPITPATIATARRTKATTTTPSVATDALA